MSKVRNVTVQKIKKLGRRGIYEVTFQERGISPYYIKAKDVSKFRNGDKVKLQRGRLSRLTK